MGLSHTLPILPNLRSYSQGTVNGIGERTGNANLMTIIPTLQLKMGAQGVEENLRNLTALSRFTDELASQESTYLSFSSPRVFLLMNVAFVVLESVYRYTAPNHAISKLMQLLDSALPLDYSSCTVVQ